MRRLAPILVPTAAIFAIAVALFVIAPYALLVMAPALALAWLVAVGAFTGERAIAFVRRAMRRRPVRPVRATTGAGHAPRTLSRGGLLLAASLASRPPPAPGVTIVG